MQILSGMETSGLIHLARSKDFATLADLKLKNLKLPGNSECILWQARENKGPEADAKGLDAAECSIEEIGEMTNTVRSIT